MNYKSIALLLAIALLITACGNPMPTAIPGVTKSPPVISTQVPPSTYYPEPIINTPIPTIPLYPAPGTPVTGAPIIPPSGFEPQPGDDSLKRDKATLDMTASELVVTASQPASANANLNGTLSDPCHSLRVVVTPPDANSIINVEVYSVFDQATACVTKIQPFSASIPLGFYSTGQYSVMVNGQKLGELVTNFAPLPGDDQLKRDVATLDMTISKVFVSGIESNQVSAYLIGKLPDPCHQLRIVVTPPGSDNKINLDLYSVVDPNKVCTTVIQPFQVIYPLGSFPGGHYSVYVNGQLLGEFDS